MATDVGNDGIHISVLRCVLDHGPIAISEIEGRLGVGATSLVWVNSEADTGGRCLWRQGHNEDGEWLHVISMAGRQILLDHDLLEHARRSSRRATIVATSSLMVSTAALVVAILAIVAN